MIEDYTNLTVSGNTFTGNTAHYEGGGLEAEGSYNSSSGTASITTSTFSGNTAGYEGGARRSTPTRP